MAGPGGAVIPVRLQVEMMAVSTRVPGVAAQRLAQTLQRGRNLVERKRKPATQIERRGGVVDAEGPDAISCK